jgi:C1A family cysteine protease
MKLFILFAFVGVFISLGHAFRKKTQWNDYKELYGKIYHGSQEDEAHRLLWLNTKEMVEDHNQKFFRGEVTYEMKINKFADQSADDISDFTGYTPYKSETQYPSVVLESEIQSFSSIPDEFNWEHKKAVTRVKDQSEFGGCGSCYAFATVAVIETQLFMKTGNLTELSEQQIMDCGGNGCEGGHYRTSLARINHLGGLQDAKSYPYTGKKRSCSYESSKAVVKIGQNIVNPKNEHHMEAYLYHQGPIAVAVNANKAFQVYKGGVFDIQCDASGLNHAVVIVGYGVDDGGIKYWIIKNSWVSLVILMSSFKCF